MAKKKKEKATQEEPAKTVGNAAVEKPAEYLCGVLDGLAARNLQIVGLQNHRVAAELVYAGLEREARARALLEKHEPPALSAQRIEHSGGAQLFVAVREFKHLRGFGGGQNDIGNRASCRALKRRADQFVIFFLQKIAAEVVIRHQRELFPIPVRGLKILKPIIVGDGIDLRFDELGGFFP